MQITPMLFLAINGIVWFYTAYISNRILTTFISMYPNIVNEKAPVLLIKGRHPEKLLFFLRSKNDIYIKNAPSLWRLKRNLKIGLFVSFIMPIVSMIGIILINL